MTGYYDVVLGLIPVALLGITTALVVVGVGLTTAVPLAALVASALMGHAMFVNGPMESEEPVATGATGSSTQAQSGRVNAD